MKNVNFHELPKLLVPVSFSLLPPKTFGGCEILKGSKCMGYIHCTRRSLFILLQKQIMVYPVAFFPLSSTTFLNTLYFLLLKQFNLRLLLLNEGRKLNHKNALWIFYIRNNIVLILQFSDFNKMIGILSLQKFKTIFATYVLTCALQLASIVQ